jgi:indolepyruvate ferredoxin oxidoreductase
VIPRETVFGRKRQIDQSACNKDFSCVKGFCPSFVSVIGGELDRSPKSSLALAVETLPEPEAVTLGEGEVYNILVTGVGGSGVVTIGALIGMAAHLEGKRFVVHDKLGMAQKFGGVASHIRVAASTTDIHAVRIPAASTHVLIGGDLVVSALPATLALVEPTTARVVLNANQTVTGEFPRNPGFDFRTEALLKRIRGTLSANVEAVEATDLAVALTGDAIGANMFMLGYALQKGWLPVGRASIERAIELNGVAVAANKRALAIGRYGAFDLNALRPVTAPLEHSRETAPETPDDLIEHRASFLTEYQDEAYAARFRRTIDRVREAETAASGRVGVLTETVAKNLFKLMAYKDEYEVARLHADPQFHAEIRNQMKGAYKLKVYLAPPLFARRDPVTGELRKHEFGPWMMGAMTYLAKLKRLRGTKFDIFGYTAERREERALIQRYEQTLMHIAANLEPHKLDAAVALAGVPDAIRGYGHIKHRNMQRAMKHESELRQAFDASAEARAVELST